MHVKISKLTAVFLLCLPVGLFAFQPIMDSWLNLGVGRNPLGVYATDLSGDGRLDLVSANYDGTSFSVLIANGNGAFIRRDYAMGVFPTRVKAADLDKDGDLDLAFSENAYGGASGVSVFKNNGDGTFAFIGAGYPVTKNPGALEIADFDGDGNLDLAVANEHQQVKSVSILKNKGDGTFAPKIDYLIGGTPGDMAVADFDGDGDVDIITLNGSTISVLKNNGDGSFAQYVDYPIGSLGFRLTAADLDGDTDADLAIANAYGPAVFSVFKNNGDGMFAPKVDFDSGCCHSDIFTADLDGDGDRDIALVGGNAVSTYKNDGTGNFETKGNFSVGRFPRDAFPADMDADGDEDLIVTNFADGLSFLLNDGNGSFMDGTDYPTVSYGPTHLFASDFNGDGYPDLAVDGGCCSPLASIFLNNGTGDFAPRIDYQTAGTGGAVIASDVDGDGDRDLITANSYHIVNTTPVAGNDVSVLINDGFGTFSQRAEYQTGDYPFSVAAGDVDSDGDNDLTVGAHSVSILLNNGDGTFAPRVDYDSLGRAVLLADLDGDGDLDFAFAKTNSYYTFIKDTIVVLRNDGAGTFGGRQKYLAGVRISSIMTSDVDGDGDLDLIAVNRLAPSGDNSVSVFKNNGDGTFGSKIDYPADRSGFGDPFGVVALDVNGDLYSDLAVTNEYSNILRFLVNNGDGTFRAESEYGAGDGPRFLAASDWDLDGDQDLAIVNSRGNKVTVLRNLGSSLPTAKLGDLNGDGKYTISDVVMMLNCVFRSFGACELVRADVNCDGALSPTDVVLEMNAVFAGLPLGC